MLQEDGWSCHKIEPWSPGKKNMISQILEVKEYIQPIKYAGLIDMKDQHNGELKGPDCEPPPAEVWARSSRTGKLWNIFQHEQNAQSNILKAQLSSANIFA